MASSSGGPGTGDDSMDSGPTKVHCPYCKLDITTYRESRYHVENCRKRQDPDILLTAEEEARAGLDDEDDDESEDESPSAEQELSKARVLLKYDDMIGSLGRSVLSPNTAAASLDDFMELPQQHELVAQLVEHSSGTKTRVYVRTQEIHARCKALKKDETFLAWSGDLGKISVENAVELIKNGIVPILERFVVPPHQVPSKRRRLLNAARLLSSRNNTNFKIYKTEPAVSEERGEVFARIKIDGNDPEASDRRAREWSLTLEIFAMETVNVTFRKGFIWQSQTFPYPEKINWTRPRPRADTPAETEFRSTPGWSLALFIVAKFDGFVGKRVDCRNQVDMAITRFFAQSVSASEEFSGHMASAEPVIRNLVPWKVTAHEGGIVTIGPRPPVVEDLTEKLSTIPVVDGDVHAVVEVLTAMLIQLVTGADYRTVFARGCITADLVLEKQEEGSQIPLQEPCLSNDRSRHWHVCAGCLDGFPCGFFNSRSRDGFLCRFCVHDGNDIGWKLLKKEPAPVITSLSRLRQKVPTLRQPRPPEASNPSDPKARRPRAPEGGSRRRRRDRMAGKLVTKRGVASHLALWLKHENKEGKLGWDRGQAAEILQQNLEILQGTHQTSSPTIWNDHYVKRELDEEVIRTLDWTGRLLSPFVPSIEAVHKIFFKEGISRSHAEGNIAVAAWCTNMILGGNPKIIAKAIKRYLNASSPEDYEQADMLAHRCMVLRCELQLNGLFGKIGTPESDYLNALKNCWTSGSMPPARYVSRERLSYPLPKSAKGRLDRFEWLPPNFEEYLRPQIELVAERYGLAETDRDLWNLRDPDLTGDVEVPFIFTQRSSVVTCWSWFACFCWFSYRLKRLLNECDNHSIEAYNDNPDSRLHLNIERFILALLHIYLSKLEKARNEPKQWDGQPPRALDDCGFESVCNIRTPWSQSVAHIIHGSVMLIGYVVLENAFPTSQGPDVYSHEVRNVTLETWLTNIARWTHDLQILPSIINQFQDLREDASDFIPNAPEAYPPGPAYFDPQDHHQVLHPVVTAPDDGFQFARHSKRAAVDKDGEDSRSEDSLESFSDSDHSDRGHAPPTGVPGEQQAGRAAIDASASTLKVQASALARASMASVPKRSNLARGRSTCYISSILQILHNVWPLAIIMRNATISDNLHDIEFLGRDPAAENHRTCLKALQDIFAQLDQQATSSSPVPEAYLQHFRKACSVIAIKKRESREEWPDRDADAHEFLEFVLQLVGAATDSSGIKDSDDENSPLKQIHTFRQIDHMDGKPLPRIEDDIDEWRNAYRNNAHASEIFDASTIHVVEEKQRNNVACQSVQREHQFYQSISLKMPKDPAPGDGFIDLNELRRNFLRDDLMAKPGARTSCSRCKQGSLVGLRRRIANEPDIIILALSRIQAFRKVKGKFIVDINERRVADPEQIDLMDWSAQLFTDAEDYIPNSVCYRLVGVLFYKPSPPHYVSFVRLGKVEAVSRENAQEVRYGRKNDGSWVKFDDLQYQPLFDYPHAEQPGFYERALMYRKADSDDSEDPVFQPSKVREDTPLFLSSERGIDDRQSPFLSEDYALGQASTEEKSEDEPGDDDGLMIMGSSPPRPHSPAPMSPLRGQFPLATQLHGLPSDMPFKKEGTISAKVAEGFWQALIKKEEASKPQSRIPPGVVLSTSQSWLRPTDLTHPLPPKPDFLQPTLPDSDDELMIIEEPPQKPVALQPFRSAAIQPSDNLQYREQQLLLREQKVVKDEEEIDRMWKACDSRESQIGDENLINSRIAQRLNLQADEVKDAKRQLKAAKEKFNSDHFKESEALRKQGEQLDRERAAFEKERRALSLGQMGVGAKPTAGTDVETPTLDRFKALLDQMSPQELLQASDMCEGHIRSRYTRKLVPKPPSLKLQRSPTGAAAPAPNSGDPPRPRTPPQQDKGSLGKHFLSPSKDEAPVSTTKSLKTGEQPKSPTRSGIFGTLGSNLPSIGSFMERFSPTRASARRPSIPTFEPPAQPSNPMPSPGSLGTSLEQFRFGSPTRSTARSVGRHLPELTRTESLPPMRPTTGTAFGRPHTPTLPSLSTVSGPHSFLPPPPQSARQEPSSRSPGSSRSPSRRPLAQSMQSTSILPAILRLGGRRIGPNGYEYFVEHNEPGQSGWDERSSLEQVMGDAWVVKWDRYFEARRGVEFGDDEMT